MATLSNAELKKYRFLPFKNDEGFRWETFLYFIENKKPFICSPKGIKKVGATTTTTIQDRDNLSQKIKEAIHSQNFSKLSNIKLFTESGQQIVLSDLEKTEDFGKFGGTGGGTEQTAVVEAAQCIVCGALSLGNQVTGLGEEELPEGSYSVPEANKVWSGYLQLSEDWQKGTVDSAEAILNAVGKGKWIFHYGDELVQQILSKFNELKKGKFKGRKDKWNPADIWISSGNVDVSGFTDFDEFSKFCFSENLKGISLKKGGTTVKECPDTKAKFEVDQWTSSIGGKQISFKFKFKNHDVEKMLTVRPDKQILKCEIKNIGSNHRNGSCGQEFLSQVLSEFGFGEVNLRSRIQELERIQHQDRVDHPGDYSDDLVRGSEQAGFEPSVSGTSADLAVLNLNPKEIQEYAAKILTKEILEFLEKEHKVEEFISRIARYCTSSLPNSCRYLKVC